MSDRVRKIAIILIAVFLVVCLVVGMYLRHIMYQKYKNLENSYQLLYKDYNTVNEMYLSVKEELDTIKAEDNSEVLIVENKYTEDEVYLLAQCVEAEAGKNNFKSQKYITQVILNRVHSSKFPNTIKDVIYQSNGKVHQFSVAYSGAMNREVKAETLANVYKVLNHGTDLPKNVLFFYSVNVKNNWLNTLPTHSIVEGTVFAYSK